MNLAANDELGTAEPFCDGRLATLEQVALTLQEPQKPLGVVLLYEDELTEQYAWEQSRRMAPLVGERRRRCCGWNLRELAEPRAFDRAMRAALQAELLILCVRAAKDLPLAFYAWADSWLPYRRHAAGTFALVLGLPEREGGRSHLMKQHLYSVARLAGMTFVVAERALAA
jgi:hypothetical protein